MTIIKSEKFGRPTDPEMRRALGDLASSVMTIDDRVAYYADKLGIYDSGPYLQLPEKMMDKVRAYMVVKHGMRHDEFMEMPFPEILRILKGDAEAQAELDRLPVDSQDGDADEITQKEAAQIAEVSASLLSKARSRSPEDPLYLPSRKVGRTVYIRRADVRRWKQIWDDQQEVRGRRQANRIK
ncbi:MAG: hypothetical protein ABIG44_02160 [Planctomycetota bacterium]